ncbi:hypothetical protein [Paenibacillus sp. IHBB 3054]|uniref:hypothetical protein n=1 Tax=Paenibacillus sp. IHBB 3054 TaxID=3425689 RepID=UPI003F673B3D
MRTIGYVLIILFNIFLLSACNSSNVNSSDFHPSSKSDVVEEQPLKDINTLIPSGWSVLIQDDEPVTTEGRASGQRKSTLLRILAPANISS